MKQTAIYISTLFFFISTLGHSETILLECESFDRLGGWVIDQQFMDQMGSPFLLAHGLGQPVEDAETSVQFKTAGVYRIRARTRDWVGPWKAPGAPGKFQIMIDGKAIDKVFGTEGAEWHWQDGGSVEIKNKNVKVSLHDLTGFEGRCDAIVFSNEGDFILPDEPEAMAEGWASGAGGDAAGGTADRALG